jgi:transcriptional regulator with XRE-family HTH domain
MTMNAAVHAEDAIATIGEKIRELRKASGRTLASIAEETGLSIGHLSQVERGLSAPSIRHLQLIAAAFGVKLSWFFDDAASPAPDDGVVVRTARRRKRDFTGLGVVDWLLSPNLSGRLELLLCELAPGAEIVEPYTHEGEEAGIVIAGEFELWVGERRYRLGEGDSFAFPSTTPHRYGNPGRTTARLVWAITPPSF